MVKTKLVEALIDDGANLLSALDETEFPVETMFWVEHPDQEYWRLVVGVSGARYAPTGQYYQALQEILERLDPAGMTLEDISVLDPETQQYEALFAVVRQAHRLARGPSWMIFDSAVVYRWTSAAARGELTCDLNAAQLMQAWEAERKALSLSRLLITVEDRRVTLRFHPEHGPKGSLDDIQQAFQVALRSPRAFPQCNVIWTS
jgi:hypothetical protein